jgi:hypothetical protein
MTLFPTKLSSPYFDIDLHEMANAPTTMEGGAG